MDPYFRFYKNLKGCRINNNTIKEQSLIARWLFKKYSNLKKTRRYLKKGDIHFPQNLGIFFVLETTSQIKIDEKLIQLFHRWERKFPPVPGSCSGRLQASGSGFHLDQGPCAHWAPFLSCQKADKADLWADLHRQKI